MKPRPDDTLLRQLGELARNEERSARTVQGELVEGTASRERIVAAIARATLQTSPRGDWPSRWRRALRSWLVLPVACSAVTAAGLLYWGQSSSGVGPAHYGAAESAVYELSLLRSTNRVRSAAGRSSDALQLGTRTFATLLLRPDSALTIKPRVELHFFDGTSEIQWPADVEIDDSGSMRLQLTTPATSGELRLSLKSQRWLIQVRSDNSP